MPRTKKDIPRTPVHPNRYPWSKALVRLLGKMPDVSLARRMRVHPATVSDERRRRRIPAYRRRLPAIQWTRQMINQLGTDFDGVIADRLGLPVYCVRRKRQLLGITACGESFIRKSPHAFRWTKQQIALLGKEPDTRVASRLGITAASVWRKRVQQGIRTFAPKQCIEWTKARITLLGKLSDTSLAKRLGVKPETVARRRRERGIAPFVQTTPPRRTPALRPLLRLPVHEICRRYRVSTETVKKLRRELGIPPVQRWPQKK
ncbi:MAG: hypothetical protein HY695_23110 [Deltaproteobacteria bacterium]|nr:hypothetical protein [Deltaproteobacteria bacterium]